MSLRDREGNLRTWVEIGTPRAERLHKASKASPRLVVFTQHDPRLLKKEAGTREIHRADEIEVYALDSRFLEKLGALTERNARWTLLRSDSGLYVTVGAETLTSTVTKYALTDSTL